MYCQPGGLIHQKRKGVLIDDAQTDLRLRTNASTLGRQCKPDHLPWKDPLIGQHWPVIRKKAAALELDPAGEVGRHGAPAQKIAQQHPLRPFLIRHPETQLHPRALPLSWVRLPPQKAGAAHRFLHKQYIKKSRILQMPPVYDIMCNGKRVEHTAAGRL